MNAFDSTTGRASLRQTPVDGPSADPELPCRPLHLAPARLDGGLDVLLRDLPRRRYVVCRSAMSLP